MTCHGRLGGARQNRLRQIRLPLIASALAVTLCVQLPAFGAAITTGLVHHWTMDETSGGTVADSVGTWDLQAKGGATLGVPGLFGFGVRLAPVSTFPSGHADYLLSSIQPSDVFQNDFTISMWLQWSPHDGKPGILEFGRFSIDLNLDLTPEVWGGALPFSGDTSIGDGKWHLLTFLASGESGVLYLDDTEIGSGGRPFFGAQGALSLGMYGGTHLFGGTIDEAAIYNRALSPAEVAANAVPEATTAFLMIVAGTCLFAARKNRRIAV